MHALHICILIKGTWWRFVSKLYCSHGISLPVCISCQNIQFVAIVWEGDAGKFKLKKKPYKDLKLVVTNIKRKSKFCLFEDSGGIQGKQMSHTEGMQM